MPKTFHYTRILSAFPKSYAGARLYLKRGLPCQAKEIFQQITSNPRVNPRGISYDRFEAGLRRALRWQNFDTGFNLGNNTTIPPVLLAKILSEEIFSPTGNKSDPIYERAEVTDFSEAQVWLNRFLYAMRELGAEDFDLHTEPKTFFVRGPIDLLKIGLRDDPHFARALFPNFNLAKGEFCYVQPVPDNLAILQFRVLDRQENLIGKYAFDAEFTEWFSAYTYTEEEFRQAQIFNHNYLTVEEQAIQTRELKKLIALCLTVVNDFKNRMFFASNKYPLPQRFKIIGPARRMRIGLDDENSLNFRYLNLEPGIAYEVETFFAPIPGGNIETLAIKFKQIGSPNQPLTYYFGVKDLDFSPMISTRMQRDKDRVVLPARMRPRPWDDEKGPGIILDQLLMSRAWMDDGFEGKTLDHIKDPALRLKFLLIHQDIDSSVLTLSSFVPTGRRGRGKYYHDLDLLVDNKLAEIRGLPRSTLASLYLNKMRAAAIEIYEEVKDGTRRAFPDNFWKGWQGQLNFIICYKYLMEEKYKFTMDPVGYIIDPRFQRKNQSAFLKTACEKEDWDNFMAANKLAGGFALTFGKSMANLMAAAYPWAFDMTQPEGKHLELDAFKANKLWQEEDGERRAWIVLDHRLRQHAEVDLETLDPRLLRGQQTNFLASQGVTCWRDLFIKLELSGMVVVMEQFAGRPSKALAWRYPKAFDLSTPEGKHYHLNDFEPLTLFSAEEQRAMFLHETVAEGWEIDSNLPQKASLLWLAEHRLWNGYESKFDLFRRVLAEEFATGILNETHFRNLGTMQSIKPAPLRRIQETKAGGLPFGKIHLEKTAYFFPVELVNHTARKASADYGYIYLDDNATTPTKVFELIPNPSKYHRPVLIDFDPGEHPIIPIEVEASLIEIGRASHQLTTAQQKDLLEFVTVNGLEKIALFFAPL